MAAGLSGFDFEKNEQNAAEWDLFEHIEGLKEKDGWESVIDIEAKVWCDGPRSPEGRCPAHVRAKVRQMISDNYARKDGDPKAIPLDPPAATRIESIARPALVVLGAHDEYVTIAMGEEMALRIPGARKIVYEDAAHMVTMEKPVEFNDAVLRFLETTDH